MHTRELNNNNLDENPLQSLGRACLDIGHLITKYFRGHNNFHVAIPITELLPKKSVSVVDKQEVLMEHSRTRVHI